MDVKKWCKLHRVHLARIPESLTWKYQAIDVGIVALFKTQLYDLWGQWMLEGIETVRARKTSWNYIQPSKLDVMDWCMRAWDDSHSHAGRF